MSSASDLRAFFTSKSSNPGVEGPMYKLSSVHTIFGFWNCKILNLNFTKGEYEGNLVLQPVDETEPIVIACYETIRNSSFFILDSHLTNEKEKGMINFKPFESNDFLVLCSSGNNDYYWAVKNKDLTFVYRQKSIPFKNTHSVDLDTLCAFVGGEITINQLQAKSYLAKVEQIKEVKREEHIRRLQIELTKFIDSEIRWKEMLWDVSESVNTLYKKISLISDLVTSSYFRVSKKKILKILDWD